MVFRKKVGKYPKGEGGGLGLMFYHTRGQLEMQLILLKWFVFIRAWQGEE